MARKETTNTFSNGLIMDLNPINTPNTVLTDCLNGTIITYNGNEHILQNDMGNFKLNGCDLKKGYIPLGIKEYAGILYIVSYNPLTKTTEIGSYPSTLVSDDNIANSEINIPGCIDLSATENGSPVIYHYKDVIKNCVITPITPINDDTIINPGDQYTFSVITEKNNENLFQCFKYYILDKDKNLHDVTDKLSKNVEEKSYVPFQIPGWLMVQNHIAEFNSFTLDIIKAEYPPFPDEGSPVKFTVRLMLTSYDNLITNNEDIIKSISFDCTYQNFEMQTDGDIQESDLYNGAKSYYKDIVITGTYGTVLNFTATPKLKTIIYDNLTQKISYNYIETESTSDLSIGNNTWKYTTDKDNSVLSLWFDTSGINSLYNKSQLILKYTIYNINKEIVKTGYQEGEKDKEGNTLYEDILYSDIEIENWNKSGFTTMLNLPLCNYTNDYKNDNYLFPENIYIIQFKIYSDKEVIKTINKLVVASELMNGFENQKLDDISFDTWFNKFEDSIKNKNFIVDAGQKISVDDDQVSIKLNTSTNFNVWKTTRNSSYPRFTQSFSGWNKDYVITGEADYSVNVTYDTNVKLLAGPLWDNLLSNSFIYVNDNKLQINSCTGKWIPTNNTYKIIDSYKKSVVYSPIFLSSEMTVKEYSKRNLINTNINFSVSAIENKINSASGSNNNSRQTTFVINGDTLGNTSKLISTKSQVNTTEDMTNVSPLSILKAKLSNIDYVYGYINMLTEQSPSKTYLTYLSANNQYEKSVNGDVTINSQASNGEFSRIEYILLPGNIYYIIDYKQGTGWDGTKVSSVSGVTSSKDVAKLINELVCYIDFDPVSTKGAFIQLSKKNSSISTGSSNIDISGNIILNNEVIFNNINLLDSSSRQSLADSLKDFNLNTTNLTEVSSGILFNTNIKLDTLSNPINIVLSDNKLQELDEDLDNIDTEITNINTEIDTESKKCQSDKWFTYDGDSGYYYESVEGLQFPQSVTNTDIKNIVKILNKEVDSVSLSVRNHPSICDEDKYNLGVKIGNITEYNIKSLNAS